MKVGVSVLWSSLRYNGNLSVEKRGHEPVWYADDCSLMIGLL